MARKPKARKFDKKLRGDKAFASKHDGLIRRLAIDKGLLTTYTEEKVTQQGVVVSVPVGQRMPSRATDEMIQDAKGYCAALVGKRKEVNNSGKRTTWAELKTLVKAFDCVHHTKVWNAFEVWMKQNPAFSQLNPKRRLAVASEVIDRMLACVARKHTMAGTVERLDESLGAGVTQAVATESKEYSDLAKLIRQHAKAKELSDIQASKDSHTHYEYRMI